MSFLGKIITLHTLRHSSSKGFLKLGHLHYPCALGRSGRLYCKSEGDGASPRGVWRLKGYLYRADKLLRPISQLRGKSIITTDLWCDDPESPLYNKPAKSPLKFSAERMWRDDSQYDLVIIIDYNLSPCMKNKGSAIFIHIRKDEKYPPTEGCISLKKNDLIKLLRLIGPNTHIHI